MNEKKQKKKRGYKNSGVIFLSKCEVHVHWLLSNSELSQTCLVGETRAEKLKHLLPTGNVFVGSVKNINKKKAQIELS